MLESIIQQFPPVGTAMTAEQFRALPETSLRVELINGVVHYHSRDNIDVVRSENG